ncbi:hypothetical protein M899_0565 [Bacteriovorax sp. BSW11_IV]|uniref:hypothetical protein n=1 Tax=Bacteriovorax sp. BSW11_IV TaxID=1353529 RepID=UPI00038A468C|nr:hypothetical protein [Bacteriovorax sp. BSW11_IV]EQC44949.1 hypothetical protein M899_0565 [Bacteriovorax sp. BSW11_IV]
MSVVKGNIWIKLIKISFVGLLLMTLIVIKNEGIDVPVDKYEKRSFYFFFFFILPSYVLFSVYYLNNLLMELCLGTDDLLVKKSSFFTYKPFSINKNSIKKIHLKNGNSTTLIIDLDKNKKLKIELLGLKEFEGQWIDPPCNQFMPSSPYGKNAHKIAYNISKKYNIPFESDFID